jgi:hypothetical protein
MEQGQTKSCKFCGETVLAVAKRCKHCHADLGETATGVVDVRAAGETVLPQPGSSRGVPKSAPLQDQADGAAKNALWGILGSVIIGILIGRWSYFLGIVVMILAVAGSVLLCRKLWHRIGVGVIGFFAFAVGFVIMNAHEASVAAEAARVAALAAEVAERAAKKATAEAEALRAVEAALPGLTTEVAAIEALAFPSSLEDAERRVATVTKQLAEVEAAESAKPPAVSALLQRLASQRTRVEKAVQEKNEAALLARFAGDRAGIEASLKQLAAIDVARDLQGAQRLLLAATQASEPYGSLSTRPETKAVFDELANQKSRVDAEAARRAEVEAQKKAAEEARANAEPPFVGERKAWCEKYQAETNEIRKSKVFEEYFRAAARAGHKVTEIAGTIEELKTLSAGGDSAILKVSTGFGRLDNNDIFQGDSANREIRAGTALYKALAEVEEGTKVLVSGVSVAPMKGLTEEDGICGNRWVIRYTRVARR